MADLPAGAVEISSELASSIYTGTRCDTCRRSRSRRSSRGSEKTPDGKRRGRRHGPPVDHDGTRAGTGAGSGGKMIIKKGTFSRRRRGPGGSGFLIIDGPGGAAGPPSRGPQMPRVRRARKKVSLWGPFFGSFATKIGKNAQKNTRQT